MSKNSFLVMILVGGILIRLVLLILSTRLSFLQDFVTGGDALGYSQLAQSILEDGAFKFEFGGQTAYRMPGYPMFLLLTSGVTNSILTTQLIQIVVDSLSVLFLSLIGRQLSKTVLGSVLAPAAIAFNPFLILSSISLLPETISTFLIVCAVYFLFRAQKEYKYSIFASLMLTGGIYLKPTIAPLASILLLTYLINCILQASHGKQESLITAAAKSAFPLFLIPFLLSPWIIRNYVVMNAFIPLTTSNGSNFYGGNNPQADGGYVNDLPYVLPNMTEVESDNFYREKAWSWIRTNPQDFLNLLPSKAFRFFWPLSLGTSGNIEIPKAAGWFLIGLLSLFYAMVAYGFWSILFVKRQFYKAILLFQLPTILLTLSLMAFGAFRFSMPGFPALALFLTIGIEETAKLTQRVQIPVKVGSP